MTKTSSIPSPARRSLPPAPALAAGGVLLVFALGVSFALGRWSADQPSPEHAGAAPRAAAPEPASLELAPPRAPPVVRATAPVVAPPAPPGTIRPEEPVARATEEVKAQIETLRPYILKNCLPSGELRGGQARATLTINSTFDSQGREIARGISEDRRAPAGELAGCVRQLQGLALSISPPGSNVGVSVPVAFP